LFHHIKSPIVGLLSVGLARIRLSKYLLFTRVSTLSRLGGALASNVIDMVPQNLEDVPLAEPAKRCFHCIELDKAMLLIGLLNLATALFHVWQAMVRDLPQQAVSVVLCILEVIVGVGLISRNMMPGIVCIVWRLQIAKVAVEFLNIFVLLATMIVDLSSSGPSIPAPSNSPNTMTMTTTTTSTTTDMLHAPNIGSNFAEDMIRTFVGGMFDLYFTFILWSFIRACSEGGARVVRQSRATVSEVMFATELSFVSERGQPLAAPA